MLILLCGAGVLVGNLAARTVAVILAGLSAIANLLFIEAYPVWSIIVITVDILVIYALTVHGRELRAPRSDAAAALADHTDVREQTAMPARRYEVRVKGRLSPRVSDAFPGMDVEEVPAETIISRTVSDATELHDVLSLIQSLGLHVVAVDQVGRSGGRRRARVRSPVIRRGRG